MGRVAKKAPEAVVEESPAQTVTQSRTRRTPKPNPKYANESVIILPKMDAEEGEEGEEKSAEKATKSTKKIAETPVSVAKVGKPRGRPAIKKQKLEYEEGEAEAEADEEKPADEDKVVPRSTRSKVDPKDTLKVGDDSVAIVDVSSIISKAPVKPESPKPTPRGPGRKRAVPEESPKEDQAKKKKEEDKPSLITSRKSYMPAKKDDKKEEPEIDTEEETKEEAPKTVKTRRTAGAAAESPQSEPAEKKTKVEVEEKVEIASPKSDTKKLPVVRRNEQITKMTPAAPKTVVSLPTKIINNNSSVIMVTQSKPIPRILNTMVTPKGKQSPNVKLAGDGTDKKVFSIDLTDDSIKVLPVKSPVSARTSPAVKENIAANNKPQPSMVLKNKLESELNRMKASANLARRNQAPMANRQMISAHNSITHPGTRRITKFESWYVIDVKNMEPAPFRHTHKQSLIKLGNEISQLQMPSGKWDYKITMQRRVRKENNNDDDEEIFTGDCGGDKTIEANREDYEPASILFKRSYREAAKTVIDRSLMLKQNLFTITMNGKQCKLIGAPDDIKSVEDLEVLLNIIDTCSLQHPCVELVTSHDISVIS